MMETGTSHNIRLGVFVIAGLFFLIIGLYFIGENRKMFGNSLKLNANFRNVNGLQSGNNVRYSGIDIGTVKKIEIINDTLIKVDMEIEDRMKNIIRKNALASIGTDGLMGNTLLNIEPGNDNASFISSGDELESLHPVNTDEMIRTLNFTSNNIATISANLKNITDDIGKSRGTLYAALMDSSLAGGFRRTLENIEFVSKNLLATTEDFAALSEDLRQGKGFIGTVLKDTMMSVELQQAVAEIKSTGERINNVSAELQSTMQKINNGNGTIATLLNDTATANHLKRSMAEIDSSARSFNENMEALKHSFLLRGYFKKQDKNNKAD